MLKTYSKQCFFAVGLGVLLFLVSCNSESKDTMPAVNDNSASTTNITTTKTDSGASSPKAEASTMATAAATNDASSKAATVVTIENMKFNPATITVNKGDKITFINKDIVAHNATEMKNAWASPLLANGQSWTFTPEKTADYYCTVHVVMKGKIIVK